MKLVIQFYADVTEQTTDNMLNYINKQIFNAKKNNKSIDELIIQIASYGGSADRGILVYNTLRQLGIPITTIGMSNVDSAAISIFCAGEKRFAMRSCRFLIHEAQIPIATGLDGAKLAEMTKTNKIINTESAKIVAKTCTNKGKGRKVKAETTQSIRNRMKNSIVWDATEAKRNHLVQDLVDGKKIFDIKAEEINMIFINNPQESATTQQIKK